MKTIIAGGRDMRMTVDRLNRFIQDSEFGISEVVCGMAKGIDETGKYWGESARVPVKQFPADWDAHGKAAGPIRNKQMAEYADALILIWDGKSRGSASMLRLARDAGLKIHEQIVEGAE